jgi:hypothetical protein
MLKCPKPPRYGVIRAASFFYALNKYRIRGKLSSKNDEVFGQEGLVNNG